jgi:hypothetical protein
LTWSGRHNESFKQYNNYQVSPPGSFLLNFTKQCPGLYQVPLRRTGNPMAMGRQTAQSQTDVRPNNPNYPSLHFAIAFT